MMPRARVSAVLKGIVAVRLFGPVVLVALEVRELIDETC